MEFIGTVGANETKYFYEAVVIVNGKPAELEIQADSAGQARETARAAGYEPTTLKYIC